MCYLLCQALPLCAVKPPLFIVFSFSSCSVNPMISLAKNAKTFMTVNNRKCEVAFI